MTPGILRKALVPMVVLLITAAALTSRLVYIRADPARGLSFSRAPYTDEGLKYYQARNRGVFGQWSVEVPYAIQGHLRSSPVPTVAGAAVFRIFGSGRVQARLISVASGTLSVMLIMLIGIRHGRPGAGLLAGALMCVNFILFSYDRLALFEAPTIFLCMAAALAFLEGGKVRLILVPILLLLAYFTRVTALSVMAAIAVAWGLEVRRRLEMTSHRQLMLAAIAAGVVLAILAALVLAIPEDQISGQLRERFSSAMYRDFPAPLVMSDLFLRTLPDSMAARWMPLLLITALLGVVRVAGRGADERGKDASGLFLLWFLMAYAMIAPLDYRPTRYYLLLLPAACYLAADWIAATAATVPPRVRSRGAWVAAGVFATAGIAAVALRFVLANRHDLLMFADMGPEGMRRFELFVEEWFIGTGRIVPGLTAEEAVAFKAGMWRRVLTMPLLGGLLFAASALFCRVWRTYVPVALRMRAGLAGATAVALAILGADAWRTADYWRGANSRWEVSAAEYLVEQSIGERPDVCIGGNWATTISMGTPYFTFPLARGNGNAWETFKRFPVTHLILERSGDELGFMMQEYPVEMSHCRMLRQMEVDGYILVLYEYDPPEDAVRPPGPFEPRGTP